MSHADVYRRAGLPFYYPLVLFLNIALIIALELLLVYRHPFPLPEQLLAQELPAYENAVILRSTDKTAIGWCLVETETGEYHVVPLRRHTLFFNRCKLYEDQIVVVPSDTAQTEITTKDGMVAATVLVGRDVESQVGADITGEMEIRPKWYGNNNFAVFTCGFYFLTGLAMSLAEAFLWHKIRG